MTEANQSGESKLIAGNKSVVVPGDLVAQGMDYLPGSGTYKDSGEVRSKVLGLVRLKGDNLVSVVPLAGRYVPQEGDGVIAIVDDVHVSSWMFELETAYKGFLSLSDGVEEYVDLQESDLTDYYDVGEVVYAKIMNVSKQKDVKLTMRDRMCRKLEGGSVMRITPAKVPRLIGRGGSMIEMIKDKTDCHIIVGQNGLVWIKGDNIRLATEAVLKVERESHVDGLTEKVASFLDSRR